MNMQQAGCGDNWVNSSKLSSMLSNGPGLASGVPDQPQQTAPKHVEGSVMSSQKYNPQQTSGVRSQDDATVDYFFQRPQPDMVHAYTNKRWAVGDDSVISQVRNVSDLERDFQQFGISGNREVSKKIWDDEKAGGDACKAMFPPSSGGNLWSSPRDDSWGASQTVGRPMHLSRRPGSLPGSSDPSSVLSPRSSETGALGVNMAEYVLGGSPVGKDLEGRLHPSVKVYGSAANGDKSRSVVVDVNNTSSQYVDDEVNDDLKPDVAILHNGVEDDKNAFSRTPGSRQNSPTDECPSTVLLQPATRGPPDLVDHTVLPPPHHLLAHHHQQQPPINVAPLHHLDGSAPQFEPVAVDPFQVDYSNHLVPPSMDSPNYSVDYNHQHQILQRPQQQQQQATPVPPIIVNQQQQAYPVGAGAAGNQQQQQQQLGVAAFTPYVISTTANTAQDPYAVGIPIAGPAVVPQYYSVQAAPWGLYPTGLLQQQAAAAAAAASGQPPAGMAAQGQQMLRSGSSGRPVTPQQSGAQEGGMASVQSPASGTPAGYQILTAAYYDQNGQLVVGNGRGLGTPVRLVSPAPILVNAPGAGQQGLSSQRRDSLTDYKAASRGAVASQFTAAGYYSAGLGSPSPAAGQLGLVQPGSLTPPLSLSGSSSNLALATLGGGTRLYSAAPGAETKYPRAATNTLTNNGLFSASFLNPRLLARSASLSKEVTGRSRLLEDFRNNRIPNLQLKDLMNHVVEFSQDQHGSRFIQQKLERATPPEKAMVFNEILSAAYSLMTDVFGNYVIQKFFEFGCQEQKQTLAQRVRGHVLPLALQMYGCRVIQKALESIPADMQVEIVKELDGHVLKCVKDQNGNHVVQKCIECVDPKHIQFIIDAFQGQVFSLSTHPYGCRVIQRILEHCLPEQINPILEELHQHTERLVQDQYGNYVIQHVLEHGRPEDKTIIVNELRGRVLVLSQHKFASNVVEKCVTYSSRTDRAFLIEEVCGMNDGAVADSPMEDRAPPPPDLQMTNGTLTLNLPTNTDASSSLFSNVGTQSAIYTMMKDQFANYVVQKMIDVAEPMQRKMLMHKIRPHVATLRKYTYGKHILAKLEKFYMKSSSELGPIGMPPNGALP